jgi:excinuclease ABC subunit A
VSGLRFIELEGVRVHNLRGISLKIRHNSLTVICGVSGSGKSSLAFDTLYAEGQRRYVETFSPSARQFLDRVERPAADRISGLPPAIAIRQQLRADGARNTLGTRSEILDSLRILFAKAGRLYCPDCHIPVESTSPEWAAGNVLERFPGSRVMIVSELRLDKETPQDEIDRLVRQGYTRCIADSKTARLEELDVARIESSLMVVVDRLKSETSAESRMAEAIANAMQLTDGTCLILAEAAKDQVADPVTENAPVMVDGVSWHPLQVSRSRVCSGCRRIMPELTSELLSFTSPLGACPECEGTGRLGAPIEPRRGKPASAPETVCPACDGKRLNRDAAAVQWNETTLPQLCSLELSELTIWLTEQLRLLPPALRAGLHAPVEHAQKRLRFLDECGLCYLSLDRTMKSLSGGEAQRVMLTTALGSGLINTLYVLDEPTAGLHATDTQKIIGIVRELQKTGNTVVVVEHDPEFILAADHVIETGPGAGENGGTIVFEGTPAELLRGPSLTGEKLRQRQAASSPESSVSGPKKTRGRQARSAATPTSSDTTTDVAAESRASESRRHRVPEEWLELTDVCCHNIQGLDVRLPLGVFCAVTGVSGSGKSSLIADTLYPALCRALNIPFSGTAEGTVRIQGASQIENVLLLDQSPVQRSRRSIPATWIGVFDDIRILLAETHEAKKRNYSRAMFSFNASSGGRCPVCEGRGVVTVEMQFLADIETVCEECQGRRFRPDVIEIRYRDRSVFDILNMTADEAFTFFNGHHRIQQRLNAVRQTGLGYLRLGQPLSTVSGGEAQRLRIAAMLAGIPLQDGETAAENRKSSQLTRSGRTLFLLDEPSSGLHLQDVERLVSCIDFLLQTGHSVIVVDHDEALTGQADWKIELGPGPGKLGGQLVGAGAATC